MAQKKKNTERENISGSVRQAHGLTTGRKQEEKRAASGNLRRGEAESVREIARRSPAKRSRSTRSARGR